MPATLPHIDDILKTLVKAPELTPTERNIIEPAQVADIKRGFNIDYIAREANNRSLGLAGEEFVKLYEQARLIHSGKELLASKIVHTSKIQGDSAGYDILSFDTNGRERLIEVKTTAYNPLVPFFVTRNELDTSTRNYPVYHLYRVFDFRRQPKLFSKQGSLENNFQLTPTQYLARAS